MLFCFVLSFHTFVYFYIHLLSFAKFCILLQTYGFIYIILHTWESFKYSQPTLEGILIDKNNKTYHRNGRFQEGGEKYFYLVKTGGGGRLIVIVINGLLKLQ